MPADAHDDDKAQLERALAELKLENETLVREREEARQELARFVYIASHDLRAPLRAITSLVEWIT
jgi:light-regulated signal transduction histidine kinase (bacteriophytochrome)